jgi:hypothetical protein
MAPMTVWKKLRLAKISAPSSGRFTGEHLSRVWGLFQECRLRGAAGHLAQGISSRLKHVDQIFTGRFRSGVATTGEHIHRRVARFGPGVNGDVGFPQKSEGCNPLWLKWMAQLSQKGGVGASGCLSQSLLHQRGIIQKFGRAVVKLQDTVDPDQSWRPIP